MVCPDVVVAAGIICIKPLSLKETGTTFLHAYAVRACLGDSVSFRHLRDL